MDVEYAVVVGRALRVYDDEPYSENSGFIVLHTADYDAALEEFRKCAGGLREEFSAEVDAHLCGTRFLGNTARYAKLARYDRRYDELGQTLAYRQYTCDMYVWERYHLVFSH